MALARFFIPRPECRDNDGNNGESEHKGDGLGEKKPVISNEFQQYYLNRLNSTAGGLMPAFQAPYSAVQRSTNARIN